MAPAASAESTTWFNTAPITFSGQNADSTGSQYPSTIQVSGQEGPMTDVDLHVNGIDMANINGLYLLLVSPSGETEVVARQTCFTGPVDALFVTFDQQAPSEFISDCNVDGDYRPRDGCGSPCAYPFPAAPAEPHSDNFDNFNNENANGTWRLYAYRECGAGSDCPASGDQIGVGWSLSIDTGPFNLDLPAGSASFGPASPYPSTRTVAGASGVISDINVRLNGVFHNHPDDIDMMLEKAGGPRVMLMSDACGSFNINAYGFLWDDEASSVMADEGAGNVCAVPNTYRPTDHQPGDSLPAPAPQAPYSTSLSAFDGVSPNGDWRLWVADDGSGDEGFYTNQFTLEYTTRPAPDTSPPETTIDKAPPARTTKRRATFEFSSSEAGSSFECKLDARPFKSCTSPKTYRRLKQGRHSFRVRATDPAGNTDPTPAKVVWRVVR